MRRNSKITTKLQWKLGAATTAVTSSVTRLYEEVDENSPMAKNTEIYEVSGTGFNNKTVYFTNFTRTRAQVPLVRWLTATFRWGKAI